MNYNTINSFSLIGNIAMINEIKEQANGKKFRSFTLAQNHNYKNKDGEAINNASFFDIKIYEKDFKKFEKILEVGKYVNVIGKINIHKSADNKIKFTLVGIDSRVLNKNKKLELFDYDWLNDKEHLKEENEIST